MKKEEFIWRNIITVIGAAVAFLFILSGEAIDIVLGCIMLVLFLASHANDKEKFAEAEAERKEHEEQLAKIMTEADEALKIADRAQENIAQTLKESARVTREAYEIIFGKDFLDKYKMD